MAGESRVSTEAAFTSYQSIATGELEAVLDAGNLKALVLRGTGKPSATEMDRPKVKRIEWLI